MKKSTNTFDINIPLLEDILSTWKDKLGANYLGYRNHVYRVVQLCFFQRDFTQEEKTKIIIAGCFHDLGIWSNETLDYLPPSINLADDYLKSVQRVEWSEEINLMIDMHHKITEYKNEKFPLVEIFRKSDIIDFSLGLITFSISKEIIHELKIQYPNNGFHVFLIQLGFRWFLKHPFNPLPIYKW